MFLAIEGTDEPTWVALGCPTDDNGGGDNGGGDNGGGDNGGGDNGGGGDQGTGPLLPVFL